MAFLLHGHPDQHGNEPVLVFWNGETAVHIAPEIALKKKLAPIEFATQEDAIAEAAKIPMKQRIYESNVQKDADGKVLSIAKLATTPLDPPQKIVLQKDPTVDVIK